MPKEYKPLVSIDGFATFNLSYEYDNPNNAVAWFISLLDGVIYEAEKSCIMDEIEESQSQVLIEGAARSIAATRYERNRKAREICLAYHGRKCKICGIRFEKEYGASFSEIIEVHHIIPVSEIGESYIVDPINDLVPLCPNCHTVIHSKKDGVYTVEEIQSIRDNGKT